VPIPDRGEVWLADLGIAAKIRPCLVLSVPPDQPYLSRYYQPYFRRQGVSRCMNGRCDDKRRLGKEGAAVADVILILNSETGRHRARVVRISASLYRIEVERLIEALDAGGVRRGEFWSRVTGPGSTSYTDREERAAALAAENLRWAQAIEP
jgi:hypothetical protein